MANSTFRTEAASAGVKLWEVADRWPMTDGNFSRLLRHEMTAGQLAKARAIIAEIVAERDMEGGRADE